MTEEDGYQIAANAIRDEINREVILDILVQVVGWTEIVTPGERPWEMAQWCRDNIKGNFHTTVTGSRWAFEQESEATVFALRWT